LQFSRGAEGN